MSAYFISFLFIIHNIRDRRNIYTWRILSDVSSEQYTQPKPQGSLSVGAGGKLRKTADGLPRYILTVMLW